MSVEFDSEWESDLVEQFAEWLSREAQPRVDQLFEVHRGQPAHVVRQHLDSLFGDDLAPAGKQMLAKQIASGVRPDLRALLTAE
jgi:hypothetical protein